MTTRHPALLAPLVAALHLAGCSGGSVRPAAAPSPRLATVYFQLKVPPAPLRAAYVSPATRSVSIAVNGASPPTVADVTAGQATYSIPVRAPEGNVVFTVNLYDAAGGTGNILSQGTITAAVAGDRPNTIPITAGGVIRSIQLAVDNPTPCIGKAATLNLSVNARDASGATIVGSYTSAVSLSSSSTAAAVTLTTTSVNGQSTVPMAYNGTNPGPVTLSASASGIQPSQVTSATVTPTGKAYAGAVVSLAGASAAGFADGSGSAAQFAVPFGVAVDAQGNLYVADSNNHRVRKVTPNGIVTTLAGSGTSGAANGTGTGAQFSSPSGVAVDAQGNLYVADTNNRIVRKLTAAGVVTTLAGGANGFVDGSGTAAGFGTIAGVAVDAQGVIYVTDQEFPSVRKVTPQGVVTVLAGRASSGFADGTGTGAQFNSPVGLTVDAQGNLYVADRGNNRVRMVTAAGVVTTVAGSTSGFADGSGAAAQFAGPFGVAFDASSGDLLVGDTGNHRLRRLTAAGVATTIAGSGTPGFADGTGTGAQLTQPFGVAVDVCNAVYLTDQTHRLRRVQ